MHTDKADCTEKNPSQSVLSVRKVSFLPHHFVMLTTNRYRLGLLLILLLAAGLRLALLASVPPGMTHDEADHGLDAWGVVNGIRPIYFTVGYGREPLFDYATALVMAAIGPTWLAGRLTAAFFSLLMLAATTAWVRHAFGRKAALLTAAGLAFNFWAVMTGRHALRSVTMPALFALATLTFWPLIHHPRQRRWWPRAVVAGLLIGLSFYSYMPARILWAAWPALLLFWLWRDRARLVALWRPLALAGTIAAAVGAPLFHYLRTSGAEARIDQLRAPLDAARASDFGPLLHNSAGALQLFFVSGDAGPVTWRYNIPGMPWLDPVSGALFVAGVGLALWLVWRGNGAQPTAALLALLWLAGGLLPALITGPEAATTRAIGLQPVLWLFPALALVQGDRWLGGWGAGVRKIGRFALLLFLATQLRQTVQHYFVIWANHPDVRVHYEVARVAALRHLNDHPGVAAAIASPAPNRFHDPALGPLFLRDPDRPIGWFNGAGGLLLPDSPETVIALSPWGELAAELRPLWECPAGPGCEPPQPEALLPLRETDADRPIAIYRRDTRALAADLRAHWFQPVAPVRLGEQVTLHGWRIAATAPDLVLLTLWEVTRSADTPPLDGLILFAHLRDAADRPPLANSDRLDVPSFWWQPGDWLVQLHRLPLSADFPATPLELVVGGYTMPAPDRFDRLPVTLPDGTPGGDTIPLTTLTLTP
jgi:4-amino-4-deoxy-L-arabinose transferase-like glycosyltransferase